MTLSLKWLYLVSTCFLGMVNFSCANRPKSIDIKQSPTTLTSRQPSSRAYGLHRGKIDSNSHRSCANAHKADVTVLELPQMTEMGFLAPEEIPENWQSYSYIGNGPLFESLGVTKGYLKSNGRVISSIDCSAEAFREGQNYQKNNSVIVRYSYEGRVKWRVVTARFLCTQLELPQFVEYMRQSEGLTVKEIRQAKRWPPGSPGPNDDLYSAQQIDFAMQSGPGVLMDGELVLDGDYNGRNSNRSFLGISRNGNPLIIEAQGHIGMVCLGFALSGNSIYPSGVKDLIHRDSSIVQAHFNLGTSTFFHQNNPKPIEKWNFGHLLFVE